jgi:hypothetical protein
MSCESRTSEDDSTSTPLLPNESVHGTANQTGGFAPVRSTGDVKNDCASIASPGMKKGSGCGPDAVSS